MLALVSMAFMISTLGPYPANAAGVPAEPWTIPAREDFAYGVASGEVTSTSAILWGRPGRAGTARLTVARDFAFTRIVKQVAVRSLAGNDFTVAVRVNGLRPGTDYAYRFDLSGESSDIGAFSTAPRAGGNQAVRFAFSGDAQATPDPETQQPFFNDFEVFDRMTEEQNDFNVLLGDTIYSDTQVGGMIEGVDLISPWTARSASEKWSVYRQNLALDPMARFRSSASLFSQWDDHEFVNNFTVSNDGRPMFDSGRRAFYDYTPMTPYSGKTGLYRTRRWGKNLQMFFLDQSSFRSRMAEDQCINPISGKADPAPSLPQSLRGIYSLLLPALAWNVSQACLDKISARNRTMLGKPQFDRFISDLRKSRATFKVVFVQEPMMHMVVNQYDRWEAYASERGRLLRAMKKVAPKNVVFLTTDMHANFVGRVRFQTYGPGEPVNTPYHEIITGPIAATTHEGQINGSVGRSDAAGLVRDVLYSSPLGENGADSGLGLTCANLDTYSYGQVEVTSDRLTVTLKDLNGDRVKRKNTSDSDDCPVFELVAR